MLLFLLRGGGGGGRGGEVGDRVLVYTSLSNTSNREVL